MAVVVIFRAPLSFRINFSNSYKNPHFMLLSDSINAMYNAGGDQIRQIIDASRGKHESLKLLSMVIHRSVLRGHFDSDDHKVINQIACLPYCYSPVRYLSDKRFFVKLVEQGRLMYRGAEKCLTWQQSFSLVSELYYCLFGSNLFSKDDDMFVEYGEDYERFKNYKKNKKL